MFTLTRPSELIANRLMKEAGAMTQDTDRELSQALSALLRAAPQHRELIGALEEAYSARASDLLDAGFSIALHWASNPACILLEN